MTARPLIGSPPPATPEQMERVLASLKNRLQDLHIQTTYAIHQTGLNFPAERHKLDLAREAVATALRVLQ